MPRLVAFYQEHGLGQGKVNQGRV